ncbi:hypothetical protein R3P38DRAFT_2795363 [Favolaschia claudopus]|uniref:Uncharacterized protein n=1 Tax=Favolaschia claudopus TaxID=2862362 RepID=A0AAW0A7W8_9AGAR
MHPQSPLTLTQRLQVAAAGGPDNTSHETALPWLSEIILEGCRILLDHAYGYDQLGQPSFVEQTVSQSWGCMQRILVAGHDDRLEFDLQFVNRAFNRLLDVVDIVVRDGKRDVLEASRAEVMAEFLATMPEYHKRRTAYIDVAPEVQVSAKATRESQNSEFFSVLRHSRYHTVRDWCQEFVKTETSQDTKINRLYPPRPQLNGSFRVCKFNPIVKLDLEPRSEKPFM